MNINRRSECHMMFEPQMVLLWLSIDPLLGPLLQLLVPMDLHRVLTTRDSLLIVPDPVVHSLMVDSGSKSADYLTLILF